MSPVHLSREQVQEIGILLKSSREQQGENLAEVAFRIALSPSQLRAIEAGDLRPFYSAGYFLQAAERYASFLNVKLPQHQARGGAQENIFTANNAQDQTVQTFEAPPAQSTVTTESQTPAVSMTAPQKTEAATPVERASTWGWLAFGASALITLGVIKISFDRPAESESTISAAGTATMTALASTESGPPATTAAQATAPIPATQTAPPVPTLQPTSTAKSVASIANPPAHAASTDRLTATSPSKTMNTLASGLSDSHLESQASTWVQLVRSNGEKTNLKIEPGQKIEFAAGTTAAVVFGQPEKAVLKIKDRTVNLKPFIAADNPTRALVILNQVRD